MKKKQDMGRTSEEMYPLVERWYKSNKKKIAFCREEQIARHILDYWLDKYKESKAKEGSPPSVDFVELEVDNRPISGNRSVGKHYSIADNALTLFAEIDYGEQRLHHCQIAENALWTFLY